MKAVLTMAHDVFISHSSVDKKVADAACAALEAAGIRCWIAPRDVRLSDKFATAIVEAIRGAQIFLLVFSSQANRSDHVARELTQAANSGKQLVTLRIEDVQPEGDFDYYLADRHWLDAMTEPFAAHLERLVKECATKLALLDTGHNPALGDTAAVPSALTTRPAMSLQPTGGKPRDGWWRRQGQLMKVGLVAAVVVVVAGVTGITGYLLRPSAAHERSAGPSSAPATPVADTPAPSLAPAPAPVPAPNTDPRAQIVQLTGSWSDQGFVDAIVNRDIRIVDLYLRRV